MSTMTLYGCSPRHGGNSDTALELFREGLTDAGVDVDALWLREHPLLPCRGCAVCTEKGRCALSGRDDADVLFAPLLGKGGTGPVVFASPIYFYHVPAGFKSFIDRAQAYYMRKLHGDEAMQKLPRREAFTIFVAGRPQGEKLFEGALLTLRYFLEPFNVTLAEPLTLRGIDAKNDLAESSVASLAVREYAQTAAERISGASA